MNFRYFVLMLILFTFLYSYGEDKTTKPVENKIDNVQIGTQVWMKKNLDVDHYINGDSIPEVQDSTKWANLTIGAWCYYNNDPVNGVVYGKLYNWYAVNDPRGLAPSGYHIPSDEEWTELNSCLGSTLAGGKLKSTGTIEGGNGLWSSPNTGVTNSSGFSGLPGGYRNNNAHYLNISFDGVWWSSAEYVDSFAWNLNLVYGIANTHRDVNDKVCGFSVRCVKDK